LWRGLGLFILWKKSVMLHEIVKKTCKLRTVLHFFSDLNWLLFCFIDMLFQSLRCLSFAFLKISIIWSETESMYPFYFITMTWFGHLFRWWRSLFTGWGHDGEQVCKVSKPYVNGLWKYLNYYKNFNVNSMSKKGHNSVNMLDRVTSSCLQVGVMMVNKCAKFQSHMSMDFENIWTITKT
jgi:hypothetical protein